MANFFIVNLNIVLKAIGILFLVICTNLLYSYPTLAQDISPYKLQYKQVDSTQLDITVYPSLKKQEKAPAIIFFFGGGWTKGTVNQFKPQAQYFSQRGMTGILVDYRVQSRNHTTPYDAVDDARDAIEFIVQHSNKLNIAPNSIVISGASAGGHLALISTFLSKEKRNFKPAAMVLFNPIINTGPDGYGYERLGNVYKTIDPMEQISKSPPPAILFYGTNDKYVPEKQAKQFCNLYEAKGGICKLKFYKGQGHGFFNYSNKKYFFKTIRKADQFLVEEEIIKDKHIIKKYEQIPKEPVLRKSGYVDSLKLVKNQLSRIDHLFASVPYWLATVYDGKSGGFYDNYSMKVRDGFAPDIQSTFFGWKSLAVDGYIYKEAGAVPKVIRKKVVQFMQSRQDSVSGYFFDPRYKQKIQQSERTKGRILGMAVSVLHSLGTEPLYPLPGEKSESNRPSFLKSTKNYKEWIRNQNWDNVWGAFDNIISQAHIIHALPTMLRDSIVSVTYSYAKSHQNKDGLWGKGQNMAQRIGGVNKLGGFLNKMDKNLPNPDLIYATMIQWLQSSPPINAKEGGCSICVPRNAIRVLFYLRPYMDQPISYDDKITIIQQTYRFMNHFKLSDGGFPKTMKEFVFAPNDINMGTTKIKQSDMNGTHLMINTRFSLYKLLQISMPPLPNNQAFKNFLPNYKFSI